MIELTLHTSAMRYRVADVCLLRRSAPYKAIPTVAPLLCIEVLSPEDGVSAMLEKIDDTSTGRHPAASDGGCMRWSRIGEPNHLHSHPEIVLMVPGTEIRIARDEVFAELDEVGWKG
jgi:hypothetical protein